MQQHDEVHHPQLTPIVALWMHQFLEHSQNISNLLDQYGSPVNIHNVEPFIENYQSHVNVLNQHGLNYLIFFARKANKCKSFVQAALSSGFGVDTASYRELAQCIDMGYDPAKLVLTAAIKNERLLRLAITHQVLIVLDNHDEIERVVDMAEQLDTTANIGIRVSGFVVDGKKIYSRFGFDIDDVTDLIINKIAGHQRLKFQGFHFHLNGYSIEERGTALLALIQCADQLRTQGIETQFIDMGGGLLMNYLADEEQWQTFERELKLAVTGKRPPLTFQNNGLGFAVVAGKLTGCLNTYPYFNRFPKAKFLDAVLSYQSGNDSVATLLRERTIALRMEPGRSLLDQTGITIARVAFRKWDSNHELLIGLEMNRTQLCSSSADFLLDPILVDNHELIQNARPVTGYLVGAYCLEQDVILKRKIKLPRLPEVGDCICFPNTAGYMMHFYESEAHLFELSKNLVVRKVGAENPRFEVLED